MQSIVTVGEDRVNLNYYPKLIEGHKMTPTSNVLSNVTSFNCYYTHAQGFLKKLPELIKIMLENDLKLSGITETWASLDMRDCEFHIEGLNMYRADRNS